MKTAEWKLYSSITEHHHYPMFISLFDIFPVHIQHGLDWDVFEHITKRTPIRREKENNLQLDQGQHFCLICLVYAFLPLITWFFYVAFKRAVGDYPVFNKSLFSYLSKHFKWNIMSRTHAAGRFPTFLTSSAEENAQTSPIYLIYLIPKLEIAAETGNGLHHLRG